MSDFVIELTKQLHGWQDETMWLSAHDVAQMIARAARAAMEADQADQAESERGLCWGYVELDRPGDLDAPECIECGQDATRGGWFAVMQSGPSDAALYGPLCDICATSD